MNVIMVRAWKPRLLGMDQMDLEHERYYSEAWMLNCGMHLEHEWSRG